MSINACSINASTINSACGAHSFLSSTVLNFTITLTQGQVVAPIVIGSFSGGPVIAIVISSGALNGPGGTLEFTTDLGPDGNIYFGGTATGVIGTYVGQVQLYGTINFVTINFQVQVVAAPTTAGGGQQRVHPATKVPLSIFRRRPDPQEEPIDLTRLEQEHVRVEVELLGSTYGETLRQTMADELGLVTISDLAPVATSVNITDLRITKGQ